MAGNLTDQEERIQREKDLHMLEFLLGAEGDLARTEFDAFQSMFDSLSQEDGRKVLTKNQRGMVFALCRKISPSGDGWDGDGLSPAERNKNVPIGKPVVMPEVLKNLPLKPPGRR